MAPHAATDGCRAPHAGAAPHAASLGPPCAAASPKRPPPAPAQEPYGLFPPLMGQGGLTPAAEMWNGRLAMLGIIALVLTSCASGKDILEVIDIGTGGLFLGK